VNAMHSHAPERKDGGPYDPYGSPYKCLECMYATHKMCPQTPKTHKAGARSKHTQTRAGWAGVGAMHSHAPERKDGGPYDPRGSPYKCHGYIYATKSCQKNHAQQQQSRRMSENTQTHAGWVGVGAIDSHAPERKDGGPNDPHGCPYKGLESEKCHKKGATHNNKANTGPKTPRHALDR
jgi:hypothetical protein